MNDGTAAKGDSPLEEQRQIYDLLSQETRHLIVQLILGHPEHLPSLDELAYMTSKNKAAIRDQLDVLVEAEILAIYDYPPNKDTRGLPWKFYGFTEYGTDILGDFNYLKGVPMARAVHQKTRKPEKIERHETAPRPPLPEPVRATFRLDDEAE
jgi:hypothetical protein